MNWKSLIGVRGVVDLCLTAVRKYLSMSPSKANYVINIDDGRDIEKSFSPRTLASSSGVGDKWDAGLYHGDYIYRMLCAL